VPTGTSPPPESQPSGVWVLRDGTPTPVQVTTGLDDDDFTEIVQGGLAANDRVIIAEQQSRANGRSSVPPPRL
jgi:HlyD family secretion protein